MSSQTQQTGGATTGQQQAQSAFSDRQANSTSGDRRTRSLHPQTREALAQAVKRASTQLKRR